MSASVASRKINMVQAIQLALDDAMTTTLPV